MCVIAVYEKRLPTLEELHKMELVNRDGGGVAWREGNLVHFKKGLSANEIYEIVSTKKLPVVVHFRAATHGGVCSELCHPFPITEKVPLVVEGRCKRVLFHNGVWSDWNSVCLDVVIHRNKKFPSGKCSDSRALAWLVACIGESVLTLIDEKVVVFAANRIDFYGDGWTVRDGVVYSNTYWEAGGYGYGYYGVEHSGKWGWGFKNKDKDKKDKKKGESEVKVEADKTKMDKAECVVLQNYSGTKQIEIDTDPAVLDNFGSDIFDE
jgi:hypothetical protein